jgi:hypothetical protein
MKSCLAHATTTTTTTTTKTTTTTTTTAITKQDIYPRSFASSRG